MSTRSDASQRSVTSWTLNKGLRVVVFHPDDSDGTTLTGHLMRMGFKVHAFWPPLDELPGQVDLVFRALVLDAREPQDAWLGPSSPPLISVIAYESPSFIDQALKMGANAILTTPIRAAGLLATIVYALQHARRERQSADRIAKLEHKLAGARHLTQAKAILMRMHSIGENEAYEMLRTQAMSNRVTVDDICHSIIQTSAMFEPKHRAAD